MKNLCTGCDAEHPRNHQICDFSVEIDKNL